MGTSSATLEVIDARSAASRRVTHSFMHSKVLSCLALTFYKWLLYFRGAVLRTGDWERRIPITHYPLPITNYPLPITNY